MPINDQILAELRSAAPPQSIEELAARIGSTPKNIAPRISTLIKKRKLASGECPWRVTRAAETGSVTSDDVIFELQQAMREKGRDRVAAASKLLEILERRGESDDVFVPEGTAAMVESLSRMMTAAGKNITAKAYREAFPLNDTAPDPVPDPEPPGAPVTVPVARPFHTHQAKASPEFSRGSGLDPEIDPDSH